MKKIINGIIHENPIFGLFLGLCPALAVTINFESAYLMGISVLFALIFSNLIISLISKFIPSNVKIPCFIIIISTFVTIIEISLSAYVPLISKVLGIYLPLLTVNCIILGRALSVASKEGVINTITDSMGIGLGYLLSISLIGLTREVLGTNSITIFDGLSSLTNYKLIIHDIFPNNYLIPNELLISPGGAFIVIGVLLGIFNSLKRGEVKWV